MVIRLYQSISLTNSAPEIHTIPRPYLNPPVIPGIARHLKLAIQAQIRVQLDRLRLGPDPDDLPMRQELTPSWMTYKTPWMGYNQAQQQRGLYQYLETTASNPSPLNTSRHKTYSWTRPSHSDATRSPSLPSRPGAYRPPTGSTPASRTAKAGCGR